MDMRPLPQPRRGHSKRLQKQALPKRNILPPVPFAKLEVLPLERKTRPVLSHEIRRLIRQQPGNAISDRVAFARIRGQLAFQNLLGIALITVLSRQIGFFDRAILKPAKLFAPDFSQLGLERHFLDLGGRDPKLLAVTGRLQ